MPPRFVIERVSPWIRDGHNAFGDLCRFLELCSRWWWLAQYSWNRNLDILHFFLRGRSFCQVSVVLGLWHALTMRFTNAVLKPKGTSPGSLYDVWGEETLPQLQFHMSTAKYPRYWLLLELYITDWLGVVKKSTMGIRINQKVTRVNTSGELRSCTYIAAATGGLATRHWIASGDRTRAESATIPLIEVWQSRETGLTDLQLVQGQQPCPTGRLLYRDSDFFSGEKKIKNSDRWDLLHVAGHHSGSFLRSLYPIRGACPIHVFLEVNTGMMRNSMKDFDDNIIELLGVWSHLFFILVILVWHSCFHIFSWRNLGVAIKCYKYRMG